MKNAMGLHGLCALFAAVVLFSVCYSYFLMPETYGLSLEEVQKLYKPVKVHHLSASLCALCFIAIWKQASSGTMRRKTSVLGALRANSLVEMDNSFGTEHERVIKERLEQIHRSKALDLADETIARRRASSLVIQYWGGNSFAWPKSAWFLPR